MKSSSKYLICYDCETGSIPSKDKPAFDTIALIEIAFAVIDMEKLEICEEVSMILPHDYKEGLVYSAEAEAIHGITESIQNEKAISLKEAYKKCLEIFKRYKNPRQLCTLCGHNIVGFDNAFLENFFKFMGDDLSKYVKFSLDTMQLAHMAYGESENYQLHTICDKEGIDLVNAHRAGDDTYANALLMINFVKKLRGEGTTAEQDGMTVKNPFREKFAL
jgi:DNA polymerase-3 subunit alpha (Gram-positive type)